MSGVGRLERLAYLRVSKFVFAARATGLIAREGYLLTAGSVVVAVAVVVVLAAISEALLWPGVVFGIALVGFVLFFFRDPTRTPPHDPEGRIVVAPADGKVIEVARDESDDYVGRNAIRISIFLSPLNVHVNRVPVGGVVERVQYFAGRYLVAWHPKSSELNERSEIGLRTFGGQRILFKQIAGAVARRIVFHVEEGDAVQTGQRFGIVKFGSRMDVILPENSEVLTSKDLRVTAGETVIARVAESQERG